MAGAALIRVKVYPDGGEPFVVDVTTRDGLKWEKGGKGRSVAQFERNPSFDDLYTLSFVAVMRDGRWPGDINEFKESCDLERLEADADNDDEAGPTQPDR